MSKIFVQENFFDDETYKIIVDQMLNQEYIPPEQYAIDRKKKLLLALSSITRGV